MVEIKPNALYSRNDLGELLQPLGLSVEQFLERVKPPKLFKSVFLGADILEALKTAERLNATKRPLPDAGASIAQLSNRRKESQPGQRLRDYLAKKD